MAADKKGLHIKCYAEPLSMKYADGLERVELYVCSEFATAVVKPGARQRVAITLITPQGRYRGGVRDYQSRGWVYLCSDLVSERDGLKVSLARILKDNGISPRDTISVWISDQVWEI